MIIGALVGGMGAGAVCGLIPLIIGERKGRTGLAVTGFLVTILGGMALGLIAAVPLAFLGSFWIQLTTPRDPSGGGTRQRGLSPLFLIAYLFGITAFLTVSWSFFMALTMGRLFASIVFPTGTGFGLTMGIVFTVMITVISCEGTATLPITDRDAFRSRLSGAIPKLRRYRLQEESETSLVLAPRTLVRPACHYINVNLGPETATIVGPWLASRELKRLIERS
jgi:hypothetical protein